MGAAIELRRARRVSLNAIRQRLVAEGASPQAINAVFRTPHVRLAVESQMLYELQEAGQWLSAPARWVFQHPGRIRSQDEAEYYLVDDFVCYVVECGVITTAIIPTAQQVETVYEMLEMSLVPMDRIPRLPRSDVMQQIRQHPPLLHAPPSVPSEPRASAPVSLVPRSALNIPRWLLKPDARMFILLPSTELAPRRNALLLRKKLFTLAGFPNGLVFLQRRVDAVEHLAIAPSASGRRAHLIDIPTELVEVDPASCGDMVPRSVVRAWNGLFERSSPGHGACVAIMRPRVARVLLALLDPRDWKVWVRDAQSVESGMALEVQIRPQEGRLHTIKVDSEPLS